MKFVKIATITLVILIALYTIFGFFILPGIVKPKIIDGIASTTGRNVTLGELNINPFALSVTVNDFSLSGKDNSRMFAVKQLYINYQLVSLFNGTLTFAEISIDNPSVTFTMNPDSSTNFSNLMPEDNTPKEQSEPMILVIDKLSIKQGNINYEDQTRTTPLVTRLDSLSLSLNNFTTKPQENGLYAFDAQIANGEKLSWKGNVNVAPPRSSGTFELSGIRGRTVWEFIEDKFNFEITKGTLGVKGEYEFFMQDDEPEFRIHNTSADVQEITIVDRANQAPAIDVTKGTINGIEFGYQAHTVSIHEINVNTATFHTTRELDGNYGLKTLMMPKPSKEESKKAWDFLIDNIQVSEGTCYLTDMNTNPPTEIFLSPITLKLEHFHMDAPDTSKLFVEAGINKNGKASVDGIFTLQPITANLKMDCSNIGLEAFQAYVDKFSRLQIVSGNLGLQGSLTYKALNEVDAVKTFAGDVTVSTFRGTDPVLNEDFLRWNMLTLKNINFNSMPTSTSIDEIITDQPYIRVILDSTRASNFNHIMLAEAQNTTPIDTTITTPKKEESKTKIGNISIVNGSMNFADLSLTPNFATGIYDLNGFIKDLNSEQLTHAELNLEGKVDKYAPVTIKGQINPLSTDMYTDIIMKFQNIELTTFTPYSGKFAGYKIDKGKLSLDLHYKLNQNNLDAENKILVDQLTLGEKVDGPDVTGLPVKLAIALLKDSHGVIDLDLPVQGNLNDPEFSIFPIIIKVLVNLITKAVMAPFKLLGSLFGGGGDDLSYFQFAPGSSTISTDQTSKLDNLAKSLQERPELQLDIRGLASDSTDGQALAVQSVLKQVRGAVTTNFSTTFTPEEQTRLLQIYKTSLKSEPDSLLTPTERLNMAATPEIKRQTVVERVKDKLISIAQVTPQDLRVLALNRASAIKEQLVMQRKVNEANIFILDAQMGASVIDGLIQLPLNLNAR